MRLFFDRLNNYFEKIYVLTIPSATERQREFSQAMEGLRFQFFYGMERQAIISGQETVSTIYNDDLARKNQRYGKSMTPGEIACAWGHRKIYEDMIANNISKGLIFEDDVFPLEENIARLDQVMAALPANWDIIFFDYDKNETPVPFKKAIYHIQHMFGFLNWNHTQINNLFPRQVNRFWKTSGYHDFADAYALTNSAARRLVDMQTPLSSVADNLLANAVTKEHLKGYISVPKLFAQRSAGKFKTIETLVEKPSKPY
jgi:glycosyl transferase, family 25